jgi:SsrA-binding protein
MAPPKKGKKDDNNKVIAENRKARFEYFIEEKFEAGLVLTGTEVKSMRASGANLAESYAEIRGEEAWLVNAHVTEFSHGNRNNHEPRRPRKLLMKRKELNKLHTAIQRKGMTLVPLKLYFNDEGRVKILVGLAKGKKLHDKRATSKDRDWSRDKARLMRDKG